MVLFLIAFILSFFVIDNEVIASEAFREPSKKPIKFVIVLNYVICLTLYVATCLKDPGFVPKSNPDYFKMLQNPEIFGI